MAFSEADLAGKDWLEKRMKQAGLKTSRDGVANISGILGNNLQEPRIVVGSHIDTVPCAGMLDGSLGGGRFGMHTDFAGTKVSWFVQLNSLRSVMRKDGLEDSWLGGICGRIKQVRLETARDLDGVRLVDLLRKQGSP